MRNYKINVKTNQFIVTKVIEAQSINDALRRERNEGRVVCVEQERGTEWQKTPLKVKVQSAEEINSNETRPNDSENKTKDT